MDEALLTGRFSVHPDMTRRGMSAKGSRPGTAQDSTHQDDPTFSRDPSSRPRSVSRSSSRADTCLRRSRSAFDVELFRRQLRLNKSLSRNRFKQEVLDLAHHPIVIRASSARTEPEGSEFDSVLGSARERSVKDSSRRHDLFGSSEKDAFQNDRFKKEPAASLKADGDKDLTDTHGKDNYEQIVTNFISPREGLNSTSVEDLSGRQSERSSSAKREDISGKVRGDRELGRDVTSPKDLTPVLLNDRFNKRTRRKRSDSGLNVLTTHRAGPRKDREDGAIVIHPRRQRARYDVSSEVMSPRRFALPDRDDTSTSSLLCYSSSSTSEDEELMNLMGHTPLYQRREGDGEESGGGKGKSRSGGRYYHRSDSDQYDTDCEVEEGSEFTEKDRHLSAACLDTDFGHLTYEAACVKFQVVPRKRIMQQLTTSRLQINFCGLNKLETKALSLGLLHNSRLDEVDLASNGMTAESITYISDCFQQNIYVTKLNLSGNTLEEKGCQALGEMLKFNTWVTHLNLSDCGITDNEIGFLAKGIQENSTVVCLNLSKNKLEIHGGRHLGAALGHNNGIECLNLSWNMLRGGGAVAVCNSLQRNHTIKELNLAWNGLGFQGSLAISEALKVNRSLIKLDLSSNRVDWDCTPYLAKALTFNRSLEVLELGYNPISMDGCMKLLEAIDRASSSLRLLSLTEIPISNTIAFKATEISKIREFTLEHGGVISTGDVFSVKRIKREDPLTLLIRYLSTMGIRVVDLFRVFDTNSKLYVSQANFIRGLKRVRAPLDEEDMLRVARRMRSDKRGDISYQELAANVRSHIREERKEDRRQQLLESKKREERRRILQSDLPLYAPPSFSYLPALYNMYGSNVFNRHLSSDFSPNSRYSRMDSVVSRRGLQSALDKTPSGTFLPRIRTPGYWSTSPIKGERQDTPNRPRFGSGPERSPAVEYSRSPLTLVKHGTKGLPGTRRPVYLLPATDREHLDKGVNTSPKAKESPHRKGLNVATKVSPQHFNTPDISQSQKRLSENPREKEQVSKVAGPKSALGTQETRQIHHKMLSKNSKGKDKSSNAEDPKPKASGHQRKAEGEMAESLPKISVRSSLVAGDIAEDMCIVDKAKNRGTLREVSPDKLPDARSTRVMLDLHSGNRGL